MSIRWLFAHWTPRLLLIGSLVLPLFAAPKLPAAEKHLCQVGSRAGAVFRRSGLSVAPRFLWECLTSPTVNPSPAPATSNGAGGFPALRSPVRFAPRVM